MERKRLVHRLSLRGYELFQAPVDIKSDRECVLAAVRSYGYALRGASDELRNDKEIVSLACSQHGHAIRWAGENLRRDPDVVLIAVAKQADALNHCPVLQSDKAFLIRCVAANRFVADTGSGFLTRAMREDEAFMASIAKAIKKKGAVKWP